ncbi:MAG TPA: hypothetical protein VFR02_08160 [bacterium]|nr:hypothetical protein [bacterium]
MPWRCPACRNRILRSARRCPVCGCSFSRFDPTGPFLWLFFLAALVFTGFILFHLSPETVAKL